MHEIALLTLLWNKVVKVSQPCRKWSRERGREGDKVNRNRKDAKGCEASFILRGLYRSRRPLCCVRDITLTDVYVKELTHVTAQCQEALTKCFFFLFFYLVSAEKRFAQLCGVWWVIISNIHSVKPIHRTGRFLHLNPNRKWQHSHR